MTKALSTYPCIVYTRPDGQSKTATCTNIYEDDAKDMESKECILSMEDTGMGFAVFIEGTETYEDGTPIEGVDCAKYGDKCEDSINRAFNRYKFLVKDYNDTRT